MTQEPHKSELASKLTTTAHVRAEELIAQNKRLEEVVLSLEERYAKLLGEVTMIKSERDNLAKEHARLKSILDQAIEQNRRDIERAALVEQQCTSLANLYVATYKLHGSLDRAEVVAAIREIVINLVGCEEFGVFEREARNEFRLISEFEANPSPIRSFDAKHPFYGPLLSAGAVWINGRDKAPSAPGSIALPVAFVPIRLKDETLGVVLLYKLLMQKTGLTDVDYELMDLLSLHAATALAASRAPA